MMFGRGGARRRGPEPVEEEPVPAVEWAGVRTFTIGTVERPVTKERPLPARGPRAIRVPGGAGESKVFAPCAYVARTASAAPASAMEACLYEDSESQCLLCYLVVEEREGGERCHRVYGAQGEEIGAVRRIPPSNKLVKHTWRMDQPGHPEIVGRHEWVSGGAKHLAERAALKVVTETVETVLTLGTYSGASKSPSRTLEWWSGGELVMVSQSITTLTIKANWLDRRLAFAYAFLGDS
ncbi:hypothetical protein [Streptomyces flavofungini]|uniref:hypothetical protein n=1 Tax=Streptomyces flavofungini TaxID=68200 RepID=UPI0025B25B7A|nr:hypothetical protein [Streptomyces flavofungini]WJV48397.1 hypothetical protein QUY26_24485 [Streptomyces flavofungini]